MQRRERSNHRLALALAGAANYYCLLLPEKNSFGDFEKVFFSFSASWLSRKQLRLSLKGSNLLEKKVVGVSVSVFYVAN